QRSRGRRARLSYERSSMILIRVTRSRGQRPGFVCHKGPTARKTRVFVQGRGTPRSARSCRLQLAKCVAAGLRKSALSLYADSENELVSDIICASLRSAPAGTQGNRTDPK